MAPCSGGIQGKSKYLAEPGDKANIQYIIQNPVKGGRCLIRLSRGHPDDPSSYFPLPATGNGYDARTGTFQCGDPEKSIEEIKAQLPYDTSCQKCTLQWIYEAPGYGSLFQCADISILTDHDDQACSQDCVNGGVCQDGMCYCGAGYFGEICQHHGRPNQFYEPVKSEGKPQEEPVQPMMFEEEQSNGGLGFFGWYFILFLIAAALALILLALGYLFFKDQAQKIMNGDKKGNESPKGRGRGGRNDEVRKDSEEKLEEERKPNGVVKKDNDDKKVDDKKDVRGGLNGN